ncbi:SOS response-associated peptidase [Blastopirellula marina]|uniref:Abasic site processing protein n=1 Tax=Blastopirellula marina TaxID=124 RepID=A0A2S8FDA4_9BACT|nr:SOS response-associated peptidase [Blastopirellula marina]PQO30136.1 hypothetical protein C5Y98_21545 [Blastopirellula marina]PTL42574.1 SOS response-associated peptidase [Blastopirellula marina]
MCGRYTLRSRLNRILDQFAVETADFEWTPRYNIAPTQNAPVIYMEGGERTIAPLRWGLIPSWAKEASIGARMINARGETVAEKPAFRAAFKRRRCLAPADGYYEWKKEGTKKQPCFFHLADDQPFALAGLWEEWNGEIKGEMKRWRSFTIITTAANPQTAAIHDRMPLILGESQWDLWLDPEFEDKTQLQAMIQPLADDDFFEIDAVSTQVNSPKNDSAECVVPIG